MPRLFAVPWLTPNRPTLLGVVVLTILVFGAFAFLKNTSGGRPAPASELITGSIPRAATVLKPPSNDQMAVFLSPASTQLTALVQSTAVDRGPVPLPRPRLVTSRDGCGCRTSHMRPSKLIQNDSGLPQGLASCRV